MILKISVLEEEMEFLSRLHSCKNLLGRFFVGRTITPSYLGTYWEYFTSPQGECLNQTQVLGLIVPLARKNS